MSDTLTVREALPQDFDQWRPLWAGYNAFYQRVGPTAFPEAVTQLTWSRFFDAYEPMHAVVAEQGGALDGDALNRGAEALRHETASQPLVLRPVQGEAQGRAQPISPSPDPKLSKVTRMASGSAGRPQNSSKAFTAWNRAMPAPVAARHPASLAARTNSVSIGK